MGERGRFKGHLLTFAFFALLGLGILVALFRLSGALSFGGTYQVRAVVPQAGSLTQGSSVTMAGVRVGVIKSVERRGVGALATIRIDDQHVTPLPADTTASLGVRTPLGENYVTLIPGSSKQKLAKDDLIQTDTESDYVDVDEILSVLRGPTRDRARGMIQGLATAVDGEGENLNATLSHTASVLDSGSSLTATLYPQRQQIAQLVDQLGDITRDIGDRETSIRALAIQGKTTFDALAGRDDAVRDLLKVLPSTLNQVRDTTGTLGELSDTGAPVIANLAVALRDVQPAVQRLVPATTEGRAVVRQLGAAAPKLEDTLGAVNRLAPRAVPALPKVQKTLCELNPGLRYLAPYTRDIVSLIEGFGSATNAYDAIGHTIRLQPLFGENSAFGLSDEASAAGYELVNRGVFGAQNGTGFKPYPQPGQANTVLEPGDKYLGPEDYAKRSDYKYPRLKSDC